MGSSIFSLKSSHLLAAALFSALPMIASAQPDIVYSDDEKRFLQALIEVRQEPELPIATQQYLLAAAHKYHGDLNEDRKRAQQLYLLAANGGNASAQEHVSSGDMANTKQAALWKTQAKQSAEANRAALLARAERNDHAAEFFLSQALAGGPDQQQAIALLKKSAGSGHLLAQLTLARKYERGLDGVESSAADRKYWLLKAADQLRPMAEKGNPLAARILARMSNIGSGVPQDRAMAAVLFHVSYKVLPSGEDNSDELLTIEQELSPERLARVNAAVAQWQPGQALPRDMRQAICTSTEFTQPNFNRQRAQAEFADFQTRMRQAVDSIIEIDLPRLDEAGALGKAREVFAPVIGPGAKGDSLLATMIQPAPRGAVSPIGVMVEDIMSKACPVGFGGTFTDDGHAVELWYVDLNPEDRGAMGAFKSPELPAHGSLVRGKFPALVFTRSANGRLLLYGMSQEMSRILSYWWNIQMM